ncbi:hypothetical protein P280DRAFT_449381 [Massarina eburnea CBS 473.64]|uniref:Rhodopsin domain-containing protein n=1 Tax=Massarina eburnea CBS 473.64 TaxID=1395130 RepID=A0A6A6S5I2_9PLEO|nr:hypothetical protein P280DRAFT_449381 [Massarina eburnea CBS 473.64]
MAHPDEIKELGDAVFGLIITLLILSWATVALRMWVRLGITKLPGWDDATMILTLLLFTCYCAFVLIITVGSRSHQQFTGAEFMQSLLYIQLSEVFYILTTTVLKISLGLFFLRLLTRPWQKYLFNTILAVSAIYGFFYFCTTIFVCGNPANLGEALLGSKRCLPTGFTLATGYLYGIINVIADWIFTLIPILILVQSDMDRRSKISVGIVMSFAAIGSISSILRMVFLKGLLFRDGPSTDSVKATIWATAEPGTGIIAASVAILRPLFRKIANDWRGKVTSRGSTKDLTYTTTFSDRESAIGLTPLGTTKSTDSYSKRSFSDVSDDTWDERISMEDAQVGVGQVMTIQVAAGQGKPLPLTPREFR